MKKIKIFNFIKKYWPAIILILFFSWLFYSLLASHMILEKEDGLYSGGSSWGDLAFHLTLINNYVERGFGLDGDPTFYGEKLVYPPFADALSAFLVKSGFGLRASLIWPSLISLIFSVWLFYLLTAKITQSRLAAFLAPFFFFFNGTIVGFKYFWIDFKASGLPFWDFMEKMPKYYAHVADFNIRFSNVITDYVLPQRTFVAGLPLGLLAVYFLWTYWESRERKNLLYGGMAISFLPLVHTHSFVALILAAGFLVIIQLFQGWKNLKTVFADWVYFAIPILLVGLPQFSLIYPWGKESFIKFNFGWMKGDDSIWVFWSKNFSPHIYIFIFTYLFVNKQLRLFVTAFLGLFVLTNLIQFQPHIYDNMKIMLWFLLIASILFAWFIAYLKERFGWKRGLFLVVPVVVSLVLVGSLSVYREYYLSWRLFGPDDIAVADFVKKNTAKEALFLTTDQHNHPVPTLAGRQVMMGFRGWLWTHGINYARREADVIEIFSGGPKALELIDDYGINYAVIDRNKIKDFHINQEFFDQNFNLLFRSGNYSLYEITL